MELVFGKLPAEAAVPEPGEIILRPAAVDQRERRDLAMLVLDAGPAAFLAGSGQPHKIVVSSDPTLDDMLAASFLLRMLEGTPLPPNCQPFAHYAALVREGLRPTQLPLEQSLEGVFLAIRGKATQDLTDPASAQIVIEGWSRMAEAILRAAEQNKDPFSTPILGAGAEFARERAFLARDLDVYRHDFLQGQAWKVRLPGGPAQALGLLLREPKSLLFKYWSRGECPPPMAGPYLFLAVAWGKGHWVFSTDPVQKVTLKPLADLLQQAEKSAIADAELDPWFDGKPFQHTLVAAPRAGTKLSDKTILHIVKKWCRTPSPMRERWPNVAAILTALLIGIFALWYFGFGTSPAPVHPAAAMLEVHDLFVLSIGVANYQNFPSLTMPAADARALATALKRQQGKLFKEVTTKVIENKDATRADIIEYGLNWLVQQPLTKRSLVVITFAGHGLIDQATNQYHFAPHDYDSDKPGSTGIYLPDLDRFLAKLPCTVILIFDTCHSGAIAFTEKDEPAALLRDIKKYVASSSDVFSKSRKSLVVIAACARDQLANETKRWGHGALTLALLEGIDGKYHYQGKFQPELPRDRQAGVVTLRELDRYVMERVEALAAEIDNPQNRQQAVNTSFTGGVGLEQIPIARD